MKDETTELSKFLSYILRHEPQSINLILDVEGWANIDELVEQANISGQLITREQIINIAQLSDKKRFVISDDQIDIRAAQGHSLKSVDINFIEKQPPTCLLHGTAIRHMESIKKYGLNAGNRQYVHLTDNADTAKATGTRYGKPIVLSLDSLAMHQDGIKFFQADNGVWLTKQVPPEYIKFT